MILSSLYHFFIIMSIKNYSKYMMFHKHTSDFDTILGTRIALRQRKIPPDTCGGLFRFCGFLFYSPFFNYSIHLSKYYAVPARRGTAFFVLSHNIVLLRNRVVLFEHTSILRAVPTVITDKNPPTESHFSRPPNYFWWARCGRWAEFIHQIYRL